MTYQDIITIEPGKRGGRHMRIEVSDVLGWLAAGMTHAEILGEYPELTEDDIRACLAYAADTPSRALAAGEGRRPRSRCSRTRSRCGSFTRSRRSRTRACGARCWVWQRGLRGWPLPLAPRSGERVAG